MLCTSAWTAARLVQGPLKADLARVESLPLVSITAFFKPGRDLRGFGCLFPARENFHALGVLFNDCIFEGRSRERSETWIFGGAGHPDICQLSDAQLIERIVSDRHRLNGREEYPLASHITRWPRALPHYTVEWEKTLRTLNVERPLFLHGNYLGALGLGAILARSKALAQEIKELYA